MPAGVTIRRLRWALTPAETLEEKAKPMLMIEADPDLKRNDINDAEVPVEKKAKTVPIEKSKPAKPLKKAKKTRSTSAMDIDDEIPLTQASNISLNQSLNDRYTPTDAGTRAYATTPSLKRQSIEGGITDLGFIDLSIPQERSAAEFEQSRKMPFQEI